MFFTDKIFRIDFLVGEEHQRWRGHFAWLAVILSHTGEEATNLSVEKNPAWAILDHMEDSLLEKLEEFNWTLSISQWQSLSDLQRFVLLKLSRPNHANKNFPRAMKEFGLGNRVGR